jgi:signal transduction histidine kinase
MVIFCLIVLALSSAWAWREVLSVASKHNANLVRVTAKTLSERMELAGKDTARLCDLFSDLSAQVTASLYIVDADGAVLCASPGARLSADDRVEYALSALLPGQSIELNAISRERHIVSYAPVPGTSLGILLEERRIHLVAPTYSFLVAVSAVMAAGLIMVFWLLLIGFQRISWPLSAVTEQARRVAAGQGFVPPDVSGPAEVEALVAAFNHMVTLLRRQRDTLHDYAARMLQSQEEERKRISRDLHDETAQELVGLMQRIDLCRLTAEDDYQVATALDELAELTGLTLAGVRRMSRDLRPLILEDLGLVAAVQAIGDDLEGQLPDGRVFCEVIGGEHRLSPEEELTAFRVVQEALTNVRKHASDADRVYVTIHFKPESLQISVEDDGCGFHMPNAEHQPNGDHLGLIGMRERAELLGGTLTLDSHPGEGTQVMLDLPITALYSRPEIERA